MPQLPVGSSVLGASTPTELPGVARWYIDGTIAQSVHVELQPGHGVWAHKGSILSYDSGIDWQLRVPGEAISRMLSGEGIAMTWITANRPNGRVSLPANQTGRIAVWDLAWGPVTCTSGSFLAAVGDVQIDVTVARRFGAALFGGAGFLLQKVSGRGVVFIHGAGDFVERDLGPGETLRVSTGNLAAFASHMGYDIVGVGGCLKVLFGAEGLFMTQMTGPGRVLLQTMKRRAGAKGAQQ